MSNRKYTLNGKEVEVIQKLESGNYLVSPIRVDTDGEEYVYHEVDAEIVPELFNSPPVQKYHYEIQKLESRIEEQRGILRKLHEEVRALQENEKARKKKYERFEQLRQLDDYIDGKITHYVILYEWDLQILEFEDAHARYSDRGEMRMLALFGNSKGNLTWKINEYSDGSGSWRPCIPCFSYQEAVEKLTEYITEEIKKAVDSPREYIIKAAQKYGIPIDPSYTEKQKEQLKEQKTSRINVLKNEISKIEEEIKTL